ncbi:unnamed protein product [Ranitomeya imitator]|uniref:Homeobox domain-containing protein n=1 Tax=Ranitomeya imitator TaxID=111125 RepID=A0ABN9MSI7_9NEOB|nr:unnamed protein product [Ranitomeya imitator]
MEPRPERAIAPYTVTQRKVHRTLKRRSESSSTEHSRTTTPSAAASVAHEVSHYRTASDMNLSWILSYLTDRTFSVSLSHTTVVNSVAELPPVVTSGISADSLWELPFVEETGTAASEFPPSGDLNSFSLSSLLTLKGREPLESFGHRPSSKKRRKSRTAFTNHQIHELEKRFIYQKYLSPADRDHIALQLGLSNAQVITWFQNRRAKLKRDLEEMKADVESLKKLPPHALEKLVSMPDDKPEEEEEDIGLCSPTSQGLFFQSSQCSSMEHIINEFSDEEIEVND